MDTLKDHSQEDTSERKEVSSFVEIQGTSSDPQEKMINEQIQDLLSLIFRILIMNIE